MPVKKCLTKSARAEAHLQDSQSATEVALTQMMETYFVPSSMMPVCQLWVYRLMAQSESIAQFFNEQQPGLEVSLAPLGISDGITQLSPRQVTQLLQAKCAELAADTSAQLPEVLADNIAQLGALVGLDDLAQELLALGVLCNTDHRLRYFAGQLRLPNIAALSRYCAVMLDRPYDIVHAALQRRGGLLSSGLLQLNFPSLLEDVFEFLSSKLHYQLQREDEPISRIFHHLWQPAPFSTLTTAAFSHIELDLMIMRHYLKPALQQQKVGVNILLYGGPGTGKTELSRLMAQELNADLFEVSSEDDDGDPISGQARLRAYRLAQRCLAGSARPMLLFDEAEDVFEQNPFSRSYTECKRWFNRLLEQNTTPCFWLTNNIDNIDPAVIRRFDLVIKVPTLPSQHRAELLLNESVLNFSAEEAAELTEHPALTAAIIQRAVGVMNTIGPVSKPSGLVLEVHPQARSRLNNKQALQHLINNTLQAQGFNVEKPLPKPSLPDTFHLAGCNPNVDIHHLDAGLKMASSARICLYGPSGAGKTAYCQHVAALLNRPLLMITAADVLGRYVGESEQRILALFKQARHENAVILLDEVDSLLLSRSHIQHSWELSMVNTMLQQVEMFDGVLLATTNQLNLLDQAALRRFDLHVHFDYLTPAQAAALLLVYCDKLNLDIPSDATRLFADMRMLTPGDFYSVARQHSFRTIYMAEDFVQALRKQVEHKTGHTAPSRMRLQ